MANIHHCKLCGFLSMGGTGNNMHVTCTKTLQKLVARKCHATRFVYVALQNEQSTHVYLCEPCADWSVRLNKHRINSKAYIPMDNVLEFMTSPRKRNVPDTRNMKRLVLHTLLQRLGPFENEHLSHPMIRDLMAIALVSKRKTIAGRLCEAWWTLNGNCQIFRDSATSAAIRCLIR